MWLRFFFISAFGWFVRLLVTSLLLKFVLPVSWSGYAIAAPLWLVTFILTFAFAEWAFTVRLPTKQDRLHFLLMWLVVNLFLQLLHAYFFFGSLYVVINSIEVYVDYLLQMAAILLAGVLTHERKMRVALSEGLME